MYPTEFIRAVFGASLAAAVGAIPAWAGADQAPAHSFPTPSPTSLFIPAGETATRLTITNPDSTPKTVQVTPMVWSQDDLGEKSLSQTDEIIVDQPQLELPANSDRSVTVSTRRPAPQGRERYFRILLSEPRPPAGDGPTLYGTLDLPLYVGTPASPSDGRLTRPKAHSSMVLFQLENRGGTQLRNADVYLRGYDAGGGMTFEVRKAGWYVLAGQSRHYTVKLSMADCQRSSKFVVTTQVASKTLVAESVKLGSACGPSSDPSHFQ